jgi:acetyl-CoA C-acetyltransferase
MEKVVIVGVGEAVERKPQTLEAASSPLDLMEAAANAAFKDAAGTEGLLTAIDAIALVRTFSDSGGALKSPFGDPENSPRALGKRLGIAPRDAVYSSVGGQSPQALVNEFSGKIARGECKGVLIAGAEALANQKALIKTKTAADWRDKTQGSLDDRRGRPGETLDYTQLMNAMTNIPGMYTVFDHARRARLGLSRADYARECAKLFAPFSQIAAANPMSMFPVGFDEDAITTSSAENPSITDLYTRAMVAKDGVNLGAALVMMSEAEALKLGIAKEHLVYPIAGADAGEHTIPHREDLGGSVAMKAAYDALFEVAGVSINDVACMDIYSCFPIAVFAACEALGIEPNDPRGLTQTGGLPFFGGPGNNYSTHGIASLVRRLRGLDEGIGLIGANGGFLSKHSVGLYAANAPETGWKEADPVALKAKVASQASPKVAEFADGPAVIESYCVEYRREGPKLANIVARLGDGRRFIAVTHNGDEATLAEMLSDDPIGRQVHVTSKGPGNRFTFDAQATKALIPAAPASLEGPFEYCKVERQARVLEVTINRPEARNCLTPEANFEMERIFDLYEADSSLWCAIVTGEGDKAFSAGNDLKYSASRKPNWVPETGFGGLTSRRGRRKPVIAAVNGYAYGGGCEIALACDVIVADATAKFALPEVKSGLTALAGGVFRLPQALPPKIAREMIITGRAMEAQEAAHYGMVNHLTDAGQAMAKAREVAEAICAVSPNAVSTSLEMISLGAAKSDPVDAIAASAKETLSIAASEDMRIGLKAFVTKQTPKWRGR